MPVIMNCLDRDNDVVVGGATFKFKPNQIRVIYQPDIANTIVRLKGEFGFVGLDDTMEDPEYRASEAGKKEILARRADGVNQYCQRLRTLIYNAQVSLRMDLERSNIKADPKVFASDGDIHNLEELLKYQTQKSDEDQKKIDRIKELEKKLAEKGN